MNIDDYQKEAGKYQLFLYAGNLERAFGLFEEAGEVAGLFKRDLRGDYDDSADQQRDEFVVKLRKELGDVLWYTSRIAADYGITMSEVCQCNLDKLEDRKQRDQLRGSGDDR
jgi:NTP pyrophosphatase (non-canonical NTP hydrolase)